MKAMSLWAHIFWKKKRGLYFFKLANIGKNLDPISQGRWKGLVGEQKSQSWEAAPLLYNGEELDLRVSNKEETSILCQ